MPSRLAWLRVLLLLALGAAAYGPTVRLGFIWDDHVMIEQNPTIREWGWSQLRHDFTSDVFNGHGDLYYRPAQIFSYRVDYSIWGLRPLGYRLTNLLFHLLNIVLVYCLLVRLRLGRRAAWIAAAFFAVHPIYIEDFIDTAGRAEIACLTFSLAALLLYLKDRRGTLLGGTLAFLVALFFKESALVLPGLTLLCFWKRRELPRIVPVLIAQAAALAFYLPLRHMAVGALPLHTSPQVLLVFFLKSFPFILSTYMGLLWWPWTLHSHRLVPAIISLWLLPLVAWASVIGAAFYAQWRTVLFGLLWFIVCLLPKSLVMLQGGFMLEHWMYPASIGLFALAGIGIHRLSRWGCRWRGQAAICAVLIVYWTAAAHAHTRWRSTDESLYRWALKFTTSRPIKYNLGVTLLEKGQAPEALPYLEESLTNFPNDPNVANALAKAYWQTGQKQKATALLNTALAAHPNNLELQQSLRYVYSK